MFFLNTKIKENLLLDNKNFRSLMSGVFFFNCSDWIERLCISWLILKTTNSILATVISFAITSIVQSLCSPFTAGAADKFGRNKIIILVGITRFFVLCFFALLVFQNKNFLILAYTASAISGINRSFLVPALQGSVINSVKENQKIRSMLIYSMIMRFTGVIGSLLGGALSIIIGVEQSILLSGFLGLIGSLSILLNSSNLVEIKNKGSYIKNIKDGLILVFGNFNTRILLVFAGVVEIFGFSFFSLLSSISKFILNSEIGIFSILQTSMAFGGFLGILFLFKWKNLDKAHSLATVLVMIFGISIILVSLSSNIISVIIFIVAIGAAAACFDAIQWIYLQKNIPAEFRSTAVSAWFITIGFGWIGNLIIGFLSDKYGLNITIFSTGIILLFSGVIFHIIYRRFK
jgi:MFS family permease